MKHDLRTELSKLNSELEMSKGHNDRFAAKLDKAFHIEKSLWNFQRYAIAASILAFLGITFLAYTSLGHFNNSNMLLSGYSDELYETETFFQNEIDTKMDFISSVENVDKQLISDIRDIDNSFKQIKTDLRKNPGDERLISAVLEIYRVKIEFLDEIIYKIQ